MADPVILKTRTVQAFETSAGARIFQIPLEAFPGFWVYSYLVLVDEFRVLIDTGSNVDSSNQGLEAGLQKVSELAGENISLETLTHILITHGHIDHFGGLAYIESRTQAQVGVHELDRRNLNNYEERLRVVAKRLRNFLLESGVSADRAESMYEMYMLPKTLFSSVDVDFTFQAVGMQLGPFEMLHVPGHCAGMVVIRLHDVLFSADHVLASISPHQAPESLTLHTGLSHYLDSLEAVRMWARGVRLTLGGHKAPIIDLSARIDEIKEEHMDRLSKVMHLLAEPKSIADVSKSLFGKTSGYNVLLALEEAGAHIEYLYQRGLLGISNLDELDNHNHSQPIMYYRLDEEVAMDKFLS